MINKWDDLSLFIRSTGKKEVDGGFRQILENLFKIEAIYGNVDDGLVICFFDDLYSSMQDLFNYEKDVLQDGLSNDKEHIREHEILLRETIYFKTCFLDGRIVITQNLKTTLLAAVINHFNTFDMKKYSLK